MATIHASTVLVGARAAILRGPSGSGKSRLALALIEAVKGGELPFGRLVADDRTEVEAAHGRLLVRPAAPLAGLIEIRGRGIVRLPYEPLAVAGWVVDLAAVTERMPAPGEMHVEIEGVTLPRFAFPSCVDARSMLLAAFRAHGGGGLSPEGGGAAVQHYR